jgi:uncharacterized RDD family membrane protein YckC
MVVTLLAIWFVIWCLYHAWTTSSVLQASLGMRAVGIHVADSAGRRLSFARAAGRHLAKSVSYATVAGVLIQPFTRRKQALHDLMSGSVVLGGRPASPRAGVAAAVEAEAESEMVV